MRDSIHSYPIWWKTWDSQKLKRKYAYGATDAKTKKRIFIHSFIHIFIHVQSVENVGTRKKRKENMRKAIDVETKKRKH